MADFYRGNTHYKSIYDLAVGAQRRADHIQYGGDTYDTTAMMNTFLEMATEGNRDELLEIAKEVQRLNSTIRYLKEIGVDLEEWIGAIAEHLRPVPATEPDSA